MARALFNAELALRINEIVYFASRIYINSASLSGAFPEHGRRKKGRE